MIIRTEADRQRAHESGKVLAQVLEELGRMTVPGVSSEAIDRKARELIAAAGGIPVFLDYQPEGEVRPYPAAICLSVNDMVVHGIPNEHPFTINEGDIVSIDSGIVLDGMVTDATRSVIAGAPDPEDAKLLAAAEEALAAGIRAAKAGAHVGDVSAAIEAVALAHGYGVPPELGGHGVGIRLHEDPFVANVGKKGTGFVLKEGHMLAIEPIFTRGSAELVFDDINGYECWTRDHSRAVQVEHTIIVGTDGGEIVTRV